MSEIDIYCSYVFACSENLVIAATLVTLCQNQKDFRNSISSYHMLGAMGYGTHMIQKGDQVFT